LNKEQHPVVFNAKAGEGFQLPIRALSPDYLIADMAEQIDLLMRIEKYPSLAIPEFTSGESGKFDPQYGTLPRWVGNELRKALVLAKEANRSDYIVICENATRELMQSHSLTPGDLGTEKSKDITIEGEKIPVLIDGRLTLRENGSIALNLTLLDINKKSEVGHLDGVAMLSAAELGMTEINGIFASSTSVLPLKSEETEPEEIQKSEEVKPEESYVSVPGVGLVFQEQQREVAEVLNNREKLPPINDPQNPFKVQFGVRPINKPNAGYVKRDIETKGGEYVLPLSKGEEFQIMIKCETEREVFVRALVDGLNTLAQREKITVKGDALEVSGPAGEGDYVVMPRVSLENAKSWVMNYPKPTNSFYVIQGFYEANGKNSTLRRFQVVDADESAAARKNYTDQLGLITIGFFEPVPRGREVGVRPGAKEKVEIEKYSGNKVPGPMMAVYNIRYLTPEALEKLPE
jgi:hypothetical protein